MFLFVSIVYFFIKIKIFPSSADLCYYLSVLFTFLVLNIKICPIFADLSDYLSVTVTKSKYFLFSLTYVTI